MPTSAAPPSLKLPSILARDRWNARRRGYDWCKLGETVGALAASVLIAIALPACGGGGGTTPASPEVSAPPGAPVIGTATPGDGSSIIAFGAPAFVGSSTIAGYTVKCISGNVSSVVDGASSPIRVTGMTNGLVYACSVTAKSAAGVSEASATVPVTPTAGTIELSWVLTPTQPVVAGLLADPDPTSIQDEGLNSSVVAQVTRNGIPMPAELIEWSTTDSSGQIQYLSDKSDAAGRARVWYLVGEQSQQTLTARHASSGKVVTHTISLAPKQSPTVGRYVSTFFEATAGTYSATSISVIPRTAPERTYYALTSIWRTNGQFALYGGLQMTDCSDPSPHPGINSACSASRGAYRGRLALLSVWDRTDPAGGVMRPVLVSSPNSTRCQTFNHEGNGLQCVAALDWSVDEKWTWKVQIIPGGTGDFQRVRVTAAKETGGASYDIATVDVPGTLDMNHFSAFNENWGGKLRANCLDVELRRLTVSSIGFWDGGRWVKPIRGRAMGGLYSEEMTRCQNYALEISAVGVDIASGGKNLWYRMADALVKDVALNRLIFPSNDQVLSQWQEINLSTVQPVQ